MEKTRRTKSAIQVFILLMILVGVAFLCYTHFIGGNWPKRFEAELDRFFGKDNWECVSEETKESRIYEEYYYSSDGLYSTNEPGKYNDWYIAVENQYGEEELWKITNHVLKINHDEYSIFSSKRLSNKQAFVLELFDIACVYAGQEAATEVLASVLSEEELECLRVEISYEGGNPEPAFYDQLWEEEWFTAEGISAEAFLDSNLYDFYLDIFLYDYKFEQLSEEEQTHMLDCFGKIEEMLLEKYGEKASFNLYFDDAHNAEYRDGVKGK